MRLVPALLDLYSLVVLAAVVISWINLDRRQPARYDCVQAHRARPGADPQSAPAHRRTGLLADGTVDCVACVQAILVDADARAGTRAVLTA